MDAIQVRFWLEGIFGEQAYAILSFVLVGMWRGSSIVAILLLAGFRAIPEDVLEYARLEPASPFRYFRSVVLPLARRFVALAVVVAITVSYLEYMSMLLESNGRITVPVLGTLVYRAEFGDGRTGYAAALSLMQLPIVVVLILILVPLIEAGVSRGIVPERDSIAWIYPARPAVRASLPGVGRSSTRRSILGQYVVIGLLSLASLAIAVFYLFPLYYTAVQSVKSRYDFIRGPLGQPFWAYRLDFQDGWGDTTQNAAFWHAALNTLIVFGSVIVVGIAAAILAAYALARYRPPGAGWLARGLFATYFIPPLAIVVPVLRLYSAIGLDNTYLGIVLLYLTLAIPFATWLFYIYFLVLDPDAEEHALLDGTQLKVFWHIVLPRAWPVIIAATVFSIGMMSSDLFYGRVFMLSSATTTLPVVMGSMVYDPDTWADANAAILMGAGPLLIAGLVLGRVYVHGLYTAFAGER
jgi:multiple sugar transport system permease protein